MRFSRVAFPSALTGFYLPFYGILPGATNSTGTTCEFATPPRVVAIRVQRSPLTNPIPGEYRTTRLTVARPVIHGVREGIRRRGMTTHRQAAIYRLVDVQQQFMKVLSLRCTPGQGWNLGPKSAFLSFVYDHFEFYPIRFSCSECAPRMTRQAALMLGFFALSAIMPASPKQPPFLSSGLSVGPPPPAVTL